MEHPIPPQPSLITARVTAVLGDRYEILSDLGEGYARLKTGRFHGADPLDLPATGDYVQIQPNPQGDSQILLTLPRRTQFIRGGVSRDQEEHRERNRPQIIAANFDVVFILQSLNQDFNPHRLERYLTLAYQSGALPVILLTKSDLIEDPLPFLLAAETIALGTPVHLISAKTQEGLSSLFPYLEPGKTIVFLGSSGVGKSSLINALAGEELMAVQEIREQDGKGRHTTTRRQLLTLRDQVFVIDTPGMRELGIWAAGDGLADAFSDITSLIPHCRFKNCTHQGEPGCALGEAIRSGSIAEDRLISYRKLKEEDRYTQDQKGYLQEKELRHKDIAKMNRDLDRNSDKRRNR